MASDTSKLRVSAYVIATGDRPENKCMTDKLYSSIRQRLQGWIEEDGVEASFKERAANASLKCS